MAPQRSNQLHIMLSDEELTMVRELAEANGLTSSDYIRQFIRREHGALPPATKPKTKPKPKRK
jgi:hypothetical protein